MANPKMSIRGRKKSPNLPADYPTLEDLVSVVEKEHIKKTLELTYWNLERTSRFLDIARNTLKAKIWKYGIE